MFNILNTLKEWAISLKERIIGFFTREDIEGRLEEVLSWIEETEEEAEKEELELEEKAETEEIREIEEELEFLEEEVESLEKEAEEIEEYYATYLEELKTRMEEGEDITEKALLAAELTEEKGLNDLAEAFLELAIKSEERMQNLQILIELLNEAKDFEDIEIIWEIAQQFHDESLLDLLLERIDFAPPEPYPT